MVHLKRKKCKLLYSLREKKGMYEKETYVNKIMYSGK